ncbi:SGNH/GDSL hydrolase family protein [Dysgonomonas macrotermitis]|uniref:Lysophospholipase L1 n=1 Tax=Dysgonomonas macrotermitis TaxID=1346286 RepID=A0A1M4UQZ9_9BACT|nr:GDSL-type esterase/lipase family protein [Dysgonomonas macrotermitis]SHE59156.1 Lysophospholipase L1 [Dysgonomonas macrotermitis]
MGRTIFTFTLLLFLTSCSFGEKVADKYNQPVNRKPYGKSMKGKRILLYGDSISSGYYPWYRSALLSLSQAAEVYPAGFSGYTTALLAQDAQLQRIYDYNPDIIICLVGGNDTGEENSVGTFGVTNEPKVEETDLEEDYNRGYFIQSVSHIMRKLESHYSMSESKPFIVFCTPLPQKRSNRFNIFSQPENWLRKRDAVVEACNKYDIKCIDFYNLCDWDFTKEPYFTMPPDLVNNRGIFTMDGLHPNQRGYEDMARIICEEM